MCSGTAKQAFSGVAFIDQHQGWRSGSFRVVPDLRTKFINITESVATTTILIGACAEVVGELADVQVARLAGLGKAERLWIDDRFIAQQIHIYGRNGIGIKANPAICTKLPNPQKRERCRATGNYCFSEK